MVRFLMIYHLKMIRVSAKKIQYLKNLSYLRIGDVAQDKMSIKRKEGFTNLIVIKAQYKSKLRVEVLHRKTERTLKTVVLDQEPEASSNLLAPLPTSILNINFLIIMFLERLKSLTLKSILIMRKSSSSKS